jgi:hypothetical protein
MNGTDLTDAMRKALELARDEGAVYAGQNVRRGGLVSKVNSSVLRALERRGLLKLQISPDGGMMGRLTPGPAALGWVTP